MRARRLALIIPVLMLFGISTLYFLAARAPQTWSPHWANPAQVVTAAGENEYGATVDRKGRWSLLWLDDEHSHITYTHPTGDASTSIALDSGDVVQPTLATIGGHQVGAWIRNRNSRTDLMVALLGTRGKDRLITAFQDPQPVEHPYLFAAPHGAIGLVFSSQRYGNFDLFLVTIDPVSLRVTPPVRLTHSQFYSFYPRAVTDQYGVIHVLHLENCCKQQLWHVMYDRYTAAGKHIGTGRMLYTITSFQQQAIISQWGEDLVVDGAGHVWGAFVGDGGAWVFRAASNGTLLGRAHLIDEEQGLSQSLSLAVDRHGGYLFWEQPSSLGTYLDARRLSMYGAPLGAAQRVAYVSGSQTNPHAALVGGVAGVLWQNVSRGGTTQFESSRYRGTVTPTLSQRLGLSLGDPWQEAIVLFVGAIGLAILTTVGNILTVLALAAVGIVSLRLLRPVPGRWGVLTALFSALLFMLFVQPGGPILFLSTMPSMGLRALPFGLVAGLGTALFTGWMGLVVLRHVEDGYRAGMMAFFGVFYFAFVESVVFVQQNLGVL